MWCHLIKNAREELCIIIHQHIVVVIHMRIFDVFDRLVHAAIPEIASVSLDQVDLICAVIAHLL